MIWVQLIYFIATFVLSELMRPDPEIEDAKPAGLGDFDFPTATEGRVVPIFWGTVRITGPNVVWYGDLRQKPIKVKVKTGMFSSESQITGYYYYIGIQFALCRGVVDELQEVWIGEESVFTGNVAGDSTFFIDEPTLFGGKKGQGGVIATGRFFDGSKTQPISTYLSAHQTLGGKTPAYRGTSHISPDLTSFYVGTSSNIDPWWFLVKRIVNVNGLGMIDPTVNTVDANIANVIYELLTDEEWGLNVDASSIDVTNFTAAADTLKTEGNGFSFLLDKEISANALLRMLEEQADCVVFQNQVSGEWQIKLIRDDYDIDLVPQLDETTAIEHKEYSRGAWEDTTNEIRIDFLDRDDDWKKTYAVAQDPANIRIQGGTIVKSTISHPGCKNAALANSLAWRELRTLSYPLAKGKSVVDRTFYSVTPGSVIALTDADLGLVKLPIRISRIDFGELADGKITIDWVEDIFTFSAGAFANPPITGWEPPSETLTALPTDEQLAFEAPRAFTFRDPLGSGEFDKIWGAGRDQGNGMSSMLMVTRQATAPTVPTGAFTEVGEIFAFMLVGELDSALAAGSAYPLTSLLVDADPDTQADIEDAFTDTPGLAEMGTNLVNLILVDDEFMLVESAETSGGDIQLNNVYRGVLDSVQADHAINARVFLIFVGGGLSGSTFAPGKNVHVKLLPTSILDELDESSATQVYINSMDNRVRRPYPPSEITLGGSLWASTTTLEDNGSDGEDYAIDLTLNRRDYRTGEGGHEIDALTQDAATLFVGYPANSDDLQVDVHDDPDGANTFLFTDTFTALQHDVLRIDILVATLGVLPTRLRFILRSRHTLVATTYSSRQEQTWDFDVTSALTGQFNFGVLDTNDDSNLYTATVAGTYNFTLTTAFATGLVEYRINGGGWLTLIAATIDNGSIAGVSISDTIEVQHTSSDSNVKVQLDMAAAGAGQDGYCILIT